MAKGAWAKLPANVQLAVSQNSFYGAGDPQLPANLPVKLNGKDVTAFNGIVFFPNGSVDFHPPAYSPAVTLSRLHGAGTAPDYTVVVQSDSGRAKVIAN